MSPLTYISHESPYLTSIKTGKKMFWLASILFEEGLYLVKVTLMSINEKTDELSQATSERLYQSMEEVNLYLQKTTSHFSEFERKILTFDQKYTEKYRREKLMEWMSNNLIQDDE